MEQDIFKYNYLGNIYIYNRRF